MFKTFSLIALLMVATTIVCAQATPKTSEQTSAEQAVLKVTQEWLAADASQDRAALNRIVADDFLGTGPMGSTVSKADIIPREGTGEGHSLQMSAQDLKARIFGDTAVLTGRGVPKTQQQERPEIRFTIIFVKRAGNWQMVGAHLSPIPRE